MSDQVDLVAAGAEADASASRGLERLEQNRGRLYYSAEADSAARDAYYAHIDLEASPADLFANLSVLLQETHQRPLNYRPAEELYPWVDLHPDGLLHHVYSGRAVEPAEVIKDDADRAHRRADRIREVLGQNPDLQPAERAAASHAIGQELRFNCEHVVPQSWFGRDEPMRGDLHHLFTCEPHCNSRRGSSPFADLSDTLRRMAECGRSSSDGFEPHEGKGPVARATLYFLLRYPAQIGNAMSEMQKSTMAVLLDWARRPVDEYERHRNAAIHEAQGNRNPLIDHPGLAERIDFGAGFGDVVP
jgi:endonuclease G, mitochondrial